MSRMSHVNYDKTMNTKVRTTSSCSKLLLNNYTNDSDSMELEEEGHSHG